jgi:hypothetical protein
MKRNISLNKKIRFYVRRKRYQPQSIPINGSQVSGQIGQAGRDLIQNQVTAEKC